MSAVPINPSRLLADLETLRRIGAVGTGVARQAFSDKDIEARRWLAANIAEAGLTPVVDANGNLFGLPPGPGQALLVGSHSDTQRLGGWLDGIFGVACGLELARSALAAGGPRIAVVSFQDEEGRFGGLTGSALWTGAISEDYADQLMDEDGVTWASVRVRAAEIANVRTVRSNNFHAYLEAHIEQGPVLDKGGMVLGVVDAIVGVRQISLRFEGQANHAGTTPMSMRRDAVQAMITFGHALNGTLESLVTESTVWTLGRLVVEPNAASIIPETATVTLQIRDAEIARLDAMKQAAATLASDVASSRGLALSIKEGFSVDPAPMAPSLIAAIEFGAEAAASGRWKKMPSGALHDASNVSRVLPTGMLFVPSVDGISHNPDEDTRPEDLVAGLAALAHAAVRIQGS